MCCDQNCVMILKCPCVFLSAYRISLPYANMICMECLPSLIKVCTLSHKKPSINYSDFVHTCNFSFRILR